MKVKAPAGKLGILFEKIDRMQLGHVVGDVAYVRMRDDSVLVGQVARGDAICKVDGTVCEMMDHETLRTFLIQHEGSERKLYARKKAFGIRFRLFCKNIRLLFIWLAQRRF